MVILDGVVRLTFNEKQGKKIHKLKRKKEKRKGNLPEIREVVNLENEQTFFLTFFVNANKKKKIYKLWKWATFVSNRFCIVVLLNLPVTVFLFSFFFFVIIICTKMTSFFLLGLKNY